MRRQAKPYPNSVHPDFCTLVEGTSFLGGEPLPFSAAHHTWGWGLLNTTTCPRPSEDVMRDFDTLALDPPHRAGLRMLALGMKGISSCSSSSRLAKLICAFSKFPPSCSASNRLQEDNDCIRSYEYVR
ncbi:hypothetical protein LIA77_04053 [Sarocladium implicatum]|nr:hypothetical protein LIA77_04053 [Sarocladium implicatum]